MAGTRQSQYKAIQEPFVKFASVPKAEMLDADNCNVCSLGEHPRRELIATVRAE